MLASFPGLHAQLLSLAVQKWGEGLEGFITWCMLLMYPCWWYYFCMLLTRQTHHVAFSAEDASMDRAVVIAAMW